MEGQASSQVFYTVFIHGTQAAYLYQYIIIELLILSGLSYQPAKPLTEHCRPLD